MKIKMLLNDSDGIDEAITVALVEWAGMLNLDEEQIESLADNQREHIVKKLEKWIHLDEITIEFDIDAGTAIVVPVGEGG